MTGASGEFEVLLRQRIELLPPGESIPRFVYHKAAELPPSQAAALIERAQAASQREASIAVKQVVGQLKSLGFVAKTAGVPCSTRSAPKDLAAALRSHPMIHTAEGAMFHRAVATACESCGLSVVSGREREVWLSAAKTWGLKEVALRKQVDDLRKSVGAPWGTDQKVATAFALLALR